jgi:hypothetical protein
MIDIKMWAVRFTRNDEPENQGDEIGKMAPSGQIGRTCNPPVNPDESGLCH